jgi:hypothetical protein
MVYFEIAKGSEIVGFVTLVQSIDVIIMLPVTHKFILCDNDESVTFITSNTYVILYCPNIYSNKILSRV